MKYRKNANSTEKYYLSPSGNGCSLEKIYGMYFSIDSILSTSHNFTTICRDYWGHDYDYFYYL